MRKSDQSNNSHTNRKKLIIQSVTRLFLFADVVASKDVEGSEEKMKYPRAIPFIISNEFCERFNFYGMKTILVLYLTRKLLYDDDTATVLYHTFNCLVYFFCIFGAIIADSWWGKFRTILWLSIVYVSGSTVIAIGGDYLMNICKVS
jgi:solute carrier family 15 (oligopeptide transporter), member 1